MNSVVMRFTCLSDRGVVKRPQWGGSRVAVGSITAHANSAGFAPQSMCCRCTCYKLCCGTQSQGVQSVVHWLNLS